MMNSFQSLTFEEGFFMLSIKIPILHQNSHSDSQCRTGVQKILMNAPIGFLIVSSEGSVFTANQSAAGMFGYDTPEEMVETVNDIAAQLYADPSDHEEIKSLLKRHREVKGFESKMKRKDGLTFWCSINSLIVREEHSRKIYFKSFILDISRYKETEKDLKESIRRYEYIAQSSMSLNSFHNIIGRSKKMQDIYILLQQVAEVDTNVLITGETGTGKELIAETLHSLSPRSKGPLIKVNCLILPEQLLDSELFGHVRGTFSGAHADKIGRVEAAEGGTLLLDEIGDISPAIQLKLLRFLQQKESERKGESKTRKSDVRIIAATNTDLAGKVAEGSFRRDLFNHLKIVNIKAPGLRERKEDIPLLANHFYKRFSDGFQKNISGISSEAMRVLMDYSWPGNVRELEHAIELGVLLCQGDIIDVEHLPGELLDRSVSVQFVKKPGTICREDLVDALKIAKGRKTEAAKILGISRRTIYRKLLKFDLLKCLLLFIRL